MKVSHLHSVRERLVALEVDKAIRQYWPASSVSGPASRPHRRLPDQAAPSYNRESRARQHGARTAGIDSLAAGGRLGQRAAGCGRLRLYAGGGPASARRVSAVGLDETAYLAAADNHGMLFVTASLPGILHALWPAATSSDGASAD